MITPQFVCVAVPDIALIMLALNFTIDCSSFTLPKGWVQDTCALEGDGPKTLAPTDGNAAWATAEGCAERAAATSQLEFFAVERWFDLEYFSSVECRARFFFVTLYGSL